ncbi:hypothetical protein C6P45_003592 [Maudiozyma exigua]|uniref:Uncharacterized protein n=1 Tax=Maudiozyma exigua TaxID=34358 RepID=A0A9P7B1X8_MAUEX|nr:hypothetical protein C6P45_003592 [Kazachstania exigua]
MAGKASKKQVQTNIKILNDLYTLSLPIVVLSLLRAFYSKSNDSTYVGTSIKWLLLNAPLLISIYVIELSGRPKVQRDPQTGSKKIIKEGLDLSQSDGLLQYLFDLIYLSLFGNIGRILFNTNKFYYALFLCPVYLCFKLYGLKQQYFGSGTKKAAAPVKEETDNKDTKSKRQMKREKKGDNQVKYKYS